MGDFGESKFKSLCARAQLVAKADRDRFGWDFVVQEPLEHDECESASHMTSFVQVKSTWRGPRARFARPRR
ncbi:hypothetical protein DDF62_16280 [Caulobacter radicis]|uniref:DUF4365 domain-containing protein n=1 Tax=Caulobacter radicis TaxID=2172650 RepID=A0A2T9JVG0_9CAUL|nr:hypothetical protein DDF65_08365 [Caulobacter radicis]PVM87674.1 hypothetical protein DDF62_16280 [Caulobacter radicis]